MASLNVGQNEKDPRRLADTIRQLVEGKTNAIVTATLTASATSTTVKAPTCSPSSYILPCALTQDACHDIPFMSFAPGTGQFVITHANNSLNTRTFGFMVVG